MNAATAVTMCGMCSAVMTKDTIADAVCRQCEMGTCPECIGRMYVCGYPLVEGCVVCGGGEGGDTLLLQMIYGLGVYSSPSTIEGDDMGRIIERGVSFICSNDDALRRMMTRKQTKTNCTNCLSDKWSPCISCLVAKTQGYGNVDWASFANLYAQLLQEICVGKCCGEIDYVMLRSTLFTSYLLMQYATYIKYPDHFTEADKSRHLLRRHCIPLVRFEEKMKMLTSRKNPANAEERQYFFDVMMCTTKTLYDVEHFASSRNDPKRYFTCVICNTTSSSSSSSIEVYNCDRCQFWTCWKCIRVKVLVGSNACDVCDYPIIASKLFEMNEKFIVEDAMYQSQRRRQGRILKHDPWAEMAKKDKATYLKLKVAKPEIQAEVKPTSQVCCKILDLLKTADDDGTSEEKKLLKRMKCIRSKYVAVKRKRLLSKAMTTMKETLMAKIRLRETHRNHLLLDAQWEIVHLVNDVRSRIALHMTLDKNCCHFDCCRRRRERLYRGHRMQRLLKMIRYIDAAKADKIVSVLTNAVV